MRRYTESIEVRMTAGRPHSFRWRGRQYVVRDVQAAWAEAPAWWRDLTGTRASTGERLWWRLEASGRTGRTGVYEVCHDEGSWHLVRTVD